MDLTSGEASQLFGSALAALLCMGYAVFIFVKGGVHAEGKGWQTKEEAPKTYFFMLFFMLILGLSSIIFTVISVFHIFYS